MTDRTDPGFVPSPDLIEGFRQDAAERARRAEHIASDVVEEFVARPENHHDVVEDVLLKVATLAARRALGFRD